MFPESRSCAYMSKCIFLLSGSADGDVSEWDVKLPSRTRPHWLEPVVYVCESLTEKASPSEGLNLEPHSMLSLALKISSQSTERNVKVFRKCAFLYCPRVVHFTHGGHQSSRQLDINWEYLHVSVLLGVSDRCWCKRSNTAAQSCAFLTGLVRPGDALYIITNSNIYIQVKCRDTRPCLLSSAAGWLSECDGWACAWLLTSILSNYISSASLELLSGLQV